MDIITEIIKTCTWKFNSTDSAVLCYIYECRRNHTGDFRQSSLWHLIYNRGDLLRPTAASTIDPTLPAWPYSPIHSLYRGKLWRSLPNNAAGKPAAGIERGARTDIPGCGGPTGWPTRALSEPHHRYFASAEFKTWMLIDVTYYRLFFSLRCFTWQGNSWLTKGDDIERRNHKSGGPYEVPIGRNNWDRLKELKLSYFRVVAHVAGGVMSNVQCSVLVLSSLMYFRRNLTVQDPQVREKPV